MDVGREIRRLREEKGWSQAKLAGAADMGVSGISQIETGARNPSAVTLAKIAAALGVGVADLFPKGQAPLPDLEAERRSYDYGPARKALDGFCAHWEDRLREGNFDQEALGEFEVAVRGFVPALHAAVAAEDAGQPPERAGGPFDGSVLWPAVERLIFLGVEVAAAYPKAEITDLRDYFSRAG